MDPKARIADVDAIAPTGENVPFVNYFHRPAGLSPEEVADFYSETVKSGTYEKELNGVSFRGPEIAADILIERYQDKENISVLDVGAGPGTLGELLARKGFRIIDGLDPSQGMLDVAAQKNVYRRLLCEFVNEKRLPIEDNEYDCCVSCGVFSEGLIPCVGLYELIRITKPGGLMYILMGDRNLRNVGEYRDRLEPLMKKLEEDGMWKQLSRTIRPDYIKGQIGIVFEFEVC